MSTLTEQQKEAILAVLESADSFVWNVLAEQESEKLAELEFDEHRGDECDGDLANMMIHMLKFMGVLSGPEFAVERRPYQEYSDWLD